MSKRPLHFGPLAAAPIPARPFATRSASAIRSAKPTLPAHEATVQRARAKPIALVAQRMEIDSPNVDTCVHCQQFLHAAAVYETDTIKVTKTIFKSALYLLRKEHRVTDGLDEAVAHLHESVAIAEQLGIPGTTHVVMHVTKKKNKGRNDSYAGYEHFHSFIVFDPSVQKLQREFQIASPRDWALDVPVATGLWGDNGGEVRYARNNYALAIVHEYTAKQLPHPHGLYPVYFSVEFADGRAVVARWSF